MKKNTPFLMLLLFAFGVVNGQEIVTLELPLSPYVTISFDKESWTPMSIQLLQMATETRVATENTMYIGGIFSKDKSREITIKYKAASTSSINSIEDAYYSMKNIMPSVYIEYSLDAIVLDKSNTQSLVFVKPFKAGFLFITVNDNTYISYSKAVELASTVKINEEYTGFSSKYDSINWRGVFLAGIMKALSP